MRKYRFSLVTTTTKYVTNTTVNPNIFIDESVSFYPQVNSNIPINLNNSLDPNKIIYDF